jgi:hypothetical protein
MAQDRLLQVLAAAKAVALQDVFDPAVEPLDHAVRPGPHRRGQAVLDARLGTEAVELVVARRGAAPEAEQPVSERLAIARRESFGLGGYGRLRSPRVAQLVAITGFQVSTVVWLNHTDEETGYDRHQFYNRADRACSHRHFQAPA